MDEIDQFDRTILNQLQVDSRITSEQLAEIVGLSATACQRRIKRLRKNGVIASQIAVVAPEKVGNRMTVIIQVVLTGARIDIVDEFRRSVRNVPEIQQCYYVTGEYDFLLIATVRDMADYEKLSHKVFFENPHIQKFNSTIVIDNVKIGLNIPL